MGQAAPIIYAIAAVASAAAGVYSAKQSADAAEEQEKLAEKNAQYEQMEAEESARRLSEENERTESLSRAMAAASGVGGESQENYLSAQELKGQREVAWMKKTGANRANIIRTEGAITAKAGKAQALASGVSSATQGVGTVYQTGAANKWWGQ